MALQLKATRPRLTMVTSEHRASMSSMRWLDSTTAAPPPDHAVDPAFRYGMRGRAARLLAGPGAGAGS